MSGHQKLVYEVAAEKFREGLLPKSKVNTFEGIQEAKRLAGFVPLPVLCLEPID